MGRYSLAASRASRWRRTCSCGVRGWRAGVLAVSAAGLFVPAPLHARGTLVS